MKLIKLFLLIFPLTFQNSDFYFQALIPPIQVNENLTSYISFPNLQIALHFPNCCLP
jgi:hypothetical protein